MGHRRNRGPPQEDPGSTDAWWWVAEQKAESWFWRRNAARSSVGPLTAGWQQRDTRFFQYRQLTSEAQRGRSFRMLLDVEGRESRRLSRKTDCCWITSELLGSIYSTFLKEKRNLRWSFLKCKVSLFWREEKKYSCCIHAGLVYQSCSFFGQRTVSFVTARLLNWFLSFRISRRFRFNCDWICLLA